MIELNDIEKAYRTERIETIALQSIQLKIHKGQFVSIMGPSGCGKSTLLNILGLLDKPSKGNYLLDGQAVNQLPSKKSAQTRNQKIGFIFQSFHLIPDLNVMDNVEIPLLYRGVGRQERMRLVAEALDRVQLSARVHHYPNQLSGGQQQRVAIARAIVGKPELLLADEPTGNLDSHMGNEVMDILKELNRDHQTTIVMVTHDEHQAKKTDAILRLFDGRLVA
ncbi:MAG: ABC transporter ATP-binding protein [Acidobacteria bacterium]|nr:ABC transporter ATP-binding protein [Acidobacteriota bacterium]MCB9397925.1 ABC transporter ATP-binding protein [Acidobacteriota bacterium]